MKKRIFLMLAIMAMLVCLFAISVSAETVLKPQTSNEYGELSFFDESITVGRINPANGFTPYIDAEGTTYARVVVGDGTTFYTFPTSYVISNGAIYGKNGKSIYCMDMASLNDAMKTATGTNPGWNQTNIYRLEIAYNTTHFNGGSSQFFQSYENMIELRLQPNSSTWDANKQMLAFWHCYNLEIIHNLDTFTFRDGTLGGAFQECRKLTNLTIGESPEVKTTQNSTFYGCTALESVNFKEAFPNLTTIGANVFTGCANLKHISIPSSVTTFTSTAFQNCTGVVFVDFNDNQNVFNADTWGLFQGCTSLLAVSLPDNFKYIPNRMFAGCTSLKAVYLPKNLERMDTNNWGEDPFNGCTNLYFVQEPFEVVDENGNFYTAESFVQPTKPNVYYMPESLSQLCTNKAGGKCFTGSYNLNPVIVFGTNMVKTTVGDGIFFECGSNGTLGSGVTAVFLGDMEQICINTNGNRPKGVKYVFANANDKSLADVNIINNTTNNYSLNDNTEGFYFCYGNCYYLLNNVKYNGTYSDDVLTKVEKAVHFAEEKNSIITPADCINNEKSINYCFCGAEMGSSEKENSALGHDHTIYVGLVYQSYLEEGVYSYKCTRCDDLSGDEKAPALFACKGYSASKTGDGISLGFDINKDAIANYTEKTGNTIKYGIFAGIEDFLGTNDIFAEDISEKVITAEIARTDFAGFDVKLVGFTTDTQKSTALAMGAYVAVTDGEKTTYSYMQLGTPDEGAKYFFASFNDLIALAE
ncbi:MAG: leucine-rich repeat domain-containing protein [Clostridia bacterium]|nr:leucine-rich repeat domain-containing protein [Clostridia bacterium]